MKKILILSIVLISCKTLDIEVVKKQIVTPGIASGITIIQYTTKLIIEKNTNLISIQIKGQSNKCNYSVIDLLDGRLLREKETLLKGSNYFIEINIPYKNSLAKSKDTLLFAFDSGKTIQKSTFLTQTLPMK